MKTDKFKNVIIPYLYGFIALVSLSPYFVWNEPSFIKLLLSFSLLVTALFFFRAKKIKSKSLFLAFFYSLIVFFLQFSHNGIVFSISSMTIVVFLFFLLDDEFKYKSHRAFYNLYALSLIPGLFVFFMLLVGFDISWSYLAVNNELKQQAGLFYRNYIGTVILSSQIYPFGSGEIFRFSGFFDEPGVVGTVSALLLIADGFNLKNYKSKVVFLAGVLSFSLAFYLLVVIFLLIKRTSLFLFLLIPVVFFTSAFFNSLQNNPIINKYVVERFSKGIDNPSSINNRASDCFIDEFDVFIKGGNVIFGNGASAHVNTGCDVSSYLTIIYNHGFIGLAIIILLYLMMLFCCNVNVKRVHIFLPFIIMFSMSVYQRPVVLSFWMILIFLGGVYFYKQTADKDVHYD
ncbi:hypothetical protein [Vibrio paracholerae]|uniref:hypothetical protein n=2 Tax=Vibrio paracholerae TaxID=650003 RepID=UPI001B369281|nr:hypothetical protein [Vibrio paracholerae]MBP8550820.1 hypothetical protein [Vibrio paracholerae]